jgi:hypothetical protein
MSSGLPFVRQSKLIFVLIQLVILCIIIILFYFAGVEDFILSGAIVFLLLALSLKFIIARLHRRGISLIKRKKYIEAIPFFEESYRFFTTHKWVDDYRVFTMFSSSRISYREMALLNIAFCQSQIGNGTKSKEYYLRTLSEFPDSEMAKTALKLIESTENIRTN